jgi:hypothetical protein
VKGKINREEYLCKANKVHSNKYNYSNTIFIGYKKAINVLCENKEHGLFEFIVNARNHIRHAQGCPKCVFLNRVGQVLNQFKIIHGDRYDYSLMDFKKSNEKVSIICKEHGIFKQKPSSHVMGQGCSKCGRRVCANKISYTKEEFIQKANIFHNNKFNYDNVVYINGTTKVDIRCQVHGLFKISPSIHLYGIGCRKCAIELATIRKTDDLNSFIKKSKNTHGDKYDYSFVESKNFNINKVIKIICPNHGFYFQKAQNHMVKNGCPSCNESTGEKEIYKYLNKKNITYIREKKFDDCFNKIKLRFDFYLPDFNICIEYDGMQHFKPIKFFGGKESFEKLLKNDKIKTEYCLKKGIKLIRISYTEKDIKKILDENIS